VYAHDAVRSLVFVLALALGAGCGGESQEEQLAEASQALQVARQEVEAASEQVEERRAELERAETAVAEAERELKEARGRLRDAESRVDLKATDATLFRAVQKRLLEARELRDVAIDADVTKGVVTLRGRVPDRETARLAVEIAGAVPGIVRVESRISVSDERMEAVEEDA
jgi:osmotically-inducible protein OsmY